MTYRLYNAELDALSRQALTKPKSNSSRVGMDTNNAAKWTRSWIYPRFESSRHAYTYICIYIYFILVFPRGPSHDICSYVFARTPSIYEEKILKNFSRKRDAKKSSLLCIHALEHKYFFQWGVFLAESLNFFTR